MSDDEDSDLISPTAHQNDDGLLTVFFNSKHDEAENSPTKVIYSSDKKCKKNLLRLLQNRELGFNPTTLTRTRSRISLSTMKHLNPIKSINKSSKNTETAEIDVFNTIYLGLTHDSSKVVTLRRNHLTDNGNYTGRELVDQYLSIYDISPSYLLQRAHILLGRRDSMTHLYGFFPLNGSFFACINFSDSNHKDFASKWYESMLSIDFILLKYSLHLSMHTFYRISCRVKKSNAYLRPFNNGVLLNTGDSITAICFSEKCPSIATQSRRVFAVCKGHLSDVTPCQTTCLNGAYIQGIDGSFYTKENGRVRIYEVNGKTPIANESTIVYVVENYISTESLIKKVVSKHITSSIPDCKIMGVVDYESDILDVGDAVSLLSFSAVVEVNHTGANCIFLKSTFCCRWLHQATNPSLISIPTCYIERIGWQIANHSERWYTPLPPRLELPQDRVFTNESVFTGESLELLTSHFPGIELAL